MATLYFGGNTDGTIPDAPSTSDPANFASEASTFLAWVVGTTAITITDQGQQLLDDTSFSAMRATLGLGSIATQAASAVALTGGTMNGVVVGGATPAAGTFTTLTSTGNADIGGDLDVNGGNVSLDRTGDAAASIFRTLADSGQTQGLRFTDPSATVQDAITTDGSDNLSVGDTDWTSQTLVGGWAVSGTLFSVTDGQFFSTYSTNGVTARITNDNAGFSNQLIRWRTARTANSAYNFLQCQSDYDGTPDVEFVLSGDGNGTCDGTWTGGGADYAEYFEWADGNLSAEDRRGLSVVLDGDKIRPALPGEEPLGVISANPSVVGDGDIGRWKGKYLRDDFGAYIWEDYEVVSWTETVTETVTEKEQATETQERIREVVTVTDGQAVRKIVTEAVKVPLFDEFPLFDEVGDPVLDDDGEQVIHRMPCMVEVEHVTMKEEERSFAADRVPDAVTVPADAARSTEQRRKLSPAFDPSLAGTYEPRSERVEWDTVGLMGKLRLRKSQPVGTRWIKMRDVSADVEEWLVR